eukprot:scaffold3434_cov59-Phaeocystis_antarctica.AAC.1
MHIAGAGAVHQECGQRKLNEARLQNVESNPHIDARTPRPKSRLVPVVPGQSRTIEPSSIDTLIADSNRERSLPVPLRIHPPVPRRQRDSARKLPTGGSQRCHAEWSAKEDS